MVHDFGFTLTESIRYVNWLRDTKTIEYKLTDDLIDDIVYLPIGSVEFVETWLSKYYNKVPEPLNIPIEFLKRKDLLNRRVLYLKGSQIDSRPCFIKETDKTKGETFLNSDNIKLNPDSYYMISELLDIESEWRGFVYNKKLVGLQNYSGDFTNFPNVKAIYKMIDLFESTDDVPIAYTIDVCISGNRTSLIELHHFYSCGLYGFADLNNLAYMNAHWFHWYRLCKRL